MNAELWMNVIGTLMLVVAATSLVYPWVPTQPLASEFVHLPLALIPLWIAHEAVMPDHMNIRVDLLIIPPILLLALAIWVIKVARFRELRPNKPNKSEQE